MLDIGNRDNWISENRDGLGDWYYTCVGDLHSFSWRAQ